MTPKLLNTLLILVSMVLYYFIITPLYSGGESILLTPGDQNIQSLIQTNKDYDATLKGVQDLVDKANSLQKQYDAYDEATRNKMKIMVPDSIDDIKLYSELTNLADQAGIPLDSVGVKDKGLGEYSVSFTVQTTYTKFKQFISYWEKSMRLFSLQSVAFTPGRTDEEVTKFNVGFSTYYLFGTDKKK